MKKIVITGLFSLVILSCDKKQSQEVQASMDTLTTSGPVSTEIVGTYKGDISCDDCEGVELSLKNESLYSLTIHLSGEEKTENSIVKEEGHYTLDTKDSILSLDKFDLRFKIGKGKLYFLDHTSEIDENEVLSLVHEHTSAKDS